MQFFFLCNLSFEFSDLFLYLANFIVPDVRIFTAVFLIFCIGLQCGDLPAQPASSVTGTLPSISADESLYDSAQQAVIYTGHAQLLQEDFLVQADRIAYYRIEEKAVASGNVRITQPGFRLIAEEFTYWPKTKSFAALNFRLGSPPLILSGASFSGTRQRIDFTETTIFINEPAPEALTASAVSGVFYPDEHIELENATLGLSQIRFLRLRHLKRPLTKENLRFTGDIGFANDLGAFFQTETVYPRPNGWGLGALFDAYSDRGILLGPAIDYKRSSAYGTTDTEFRGGYINDRGDLGRDRVGQPVEANRYFFHLKHLTSADEHFSLVSRVAWWSDSEVTRDLREGWFRDNQQPDNYLEANYLWKNITFSVFSRVDLNKFHYFSERLPEVRIDLAPAECIPDTGLLHSGFISYAFLRDNSWRVSSMTAPWLPSWSSRGLSPRFVPPNSLTLSLPTSPHFYPFVSALDRQSSISSAEEKTLAKDVAIANWHRFSAGYFLRRPCKLYHGIRLTPLIGVRTALYDEGYSRVEGQLGANLNIDFTGTYQLENKIWGLSGLRHRLGLFAQYRWIPNSDQEIPKIHPQDAYLPFTVAPEIDLESSRSIDWIPYTQVLRFGLRNVLETKSTQYGSRELARGEIFQDFDFEPWDYGFRDNHWQNIYLRARVTPAPWLSLSYDERFRTTNFQSEFHRIALSIRDAEVWQTNLFAEYLQPYDHPNYLEQYGVDFFARLTRKWGAGVLLIFDANLEKIVENRYTIRQYIGRTWEIEYRVGYRNNSTRENDLRFSVSLAYNTF